MSMREQLGYPTSQRTGQGQPVLPRRQLAAEQERLRRLQQQGYQTGQGQVLRQPTQQQVNTEENILDEEEYDDVWPARLPTSTRRYNVPTDQTTWEYMQGNRRFIFHQGLPLARPAQRQEAYSEEPRSRSRVHWLLYLGVGMLAMLALWVVGSILLTWWQVTQDDWRYGRPRTFQVDAVVGHNDSAANPSHFIAINLNRHVEVIECPGGDCSHAVIYLGPILFGDGEDVTPVTLTFQDVNGDGKPDMVIHIQDQRMVFINENGKFRPAKPGEVKRLS
jgi:hypothetical protein